MKRLDRNILYNVVTIGWVVVICFWIVMMAVGLVVGIIGMGKVMGG